MNAPRALFATLRPRVTRTPRTAARSFSLWPASTPVPPPPVPEPERSFDFAATVATSPDLSPILTQTSSVLEPLSATLLSLPPALGLSYALFLPVATFLLRSTTTLPIIMWQRARTRKFADVVMPEIRRAQQAASLQVRDESRRAGKSYEEYHIAFTAKAKAEAKRIIRFYRANPRLTLLLPPLLHLPIFITTTLAIRDASARSLSAMSLIPDTTSAAASYSDVALAHLHQFAATPFLWCESLVLPDPYMALPLAVGLAALANVEVSAGHRARTTSDALASADARAESWNKEMAAGGPRAAPTMSVAAKRRLAIERARRGTGARGYAVRVRTPPSKPEPMVAPRPVEDQGPEKKSSGLMTFVMRVAAIAFIPFAAMSPSAVCIYWLSSQLFTLFQNITFHSIDRRRDARLQ